MAMFTPALDYAQWLNNIEKLLADRQDRAVVIECMCLSEVLLKDLYAYILHNTREDKRHRLFEIERKYCRSDHTYRELCAGALKGLFAEAKVLSRLQNKDPNHAQRDYQKAAELFASSFFMPLELRNDVVHKASTPTHDDATLIFGTLKKFLSVCCLVESNSEQSELLPSEPLPSDEALRALHCIWPNFSPTELGVADWQMDARQLAYLQLQSDEKPPASPAEWQAAYQNKLSLYRVYLQHLRQHLTDPFGLNSFEATDQGGLFVKNPLLEYYKKTDPKTGQEVLETREHKLLTAKEHQHLLIVGGSGEGKSTILKYLAYQQALANSQTLPLFLSLNALAHGGMGQSPQQSFTTLVEYLYERKTEAFHYLQQAFQYWQAVNATNSQDFKGWLIKLFQTQKVTLYLDGWDEIPSQALDNLIRWLQALQQQRLSIVLSSRHKDRLPLQGFEAWTVTFDQERQAQYVRAFFRRQQAPDIADSQVLNYLQSAPQLLCKPLFLTLLCTYWQQRTQDFQTPTELLSFFSTQILGLHNPHVRQSDRYAFLFKLLQQPASTDPDAIELVQQDCKDFLSYLAFRMQCSNNQLNPENLLTWLQFSAADVRLSSKPFMRNPILQALLPCSTEVPRKALLMLRQLLKNIVKTGLLQPIPGLNDSYTFAHKTFQEYFCADFMTQNMSQEDLQFFFSNKRFVPASHLEVGDIADNISNWPFEIDSVSAPHAPPATWCWDFIKQAFLLSQEFKDYAHQQGFSLSDAVPMYPVMHFSNPDWQQVFQSVVAIKPDFWLHQWEQLQDLRQTTDPQTDIPFNAEDYWLSKDLDCLLENPFLPEIAVDALLEGLKDADNEERDVYFHALGKQVSLPPKAINALMNGIQDRSASMRIACKNALSKQKNLPESFIMALIDGLKNKCYLVRSACTGVLGNQSNLPEQAFQALIIGLKDENDVVRSSCAEALGKQANLPEQAISTLVDGLKDEDDVVRSSCASALGEQANLPEQAIYALIDGVEDKKSFVGRSCAEALGRQINLTDKIMTALIDGLKKFSSDSSIYDYFLIALKKEVNLPVKAIISLIDGLKDKDDLIRKNCASALGDQANLPEQAIIALIDGLKDKKSFVGRFCAMALGDQSNLPEQAIQALIHGFMNINPSRQNDDWVRSACAEALSKQQINLPKEVINALIDGLNIHEESLVRRACAYALGTQTHLPEKALNALIYGLKDVDSSIRIVHAGALGEQPNLPVQAIHALMDGLKDEDDLMRSYCAEALGKQANLPEQAIHALIERLKDEEESPRIACAIALGKQASLSLQAIYALMDGLQDGSNSVRNACRNALGTQLNNPHLYLLPQQQLSNFTEHKEEIIFKLPLQQIHELLIAQAVGLLA